MSEKLMIHLMMTQPLEEISEGDHIEVTTPTADLSDVGFHHHYPDLGRYGSIITRVIYVFGECIDSNTVHIHHVHPEELF